MGAKAERLIEDHPRAAAAGGMMAGVAATQVASSAAGGALGAGSGKRKEGAKAGLHAMKEQYKHPIESTKAQFTDPMSERFNPYMAGRKLREKKD